MSDNLTIAGWDKWQTYRKDRGTPPWIKVHRNLMTNPEWAVLSDSEKGQLISIWIIAADKKGEISSDPKLIRKMCQLDEVPNINRFIELGFMTSSGCQAVVSLAAVCQPSDAPETETETETDKKKQKRGFIKPSFDEIKDFIIDKKYNVDASTFFNHYESNGWKVGKNSMKNWKAAVGNWNSRNNKDEKAKQNNGKFDPSQYILDGINDDIQAGVWEVSSDLRK